MQLVARGIEGHSTGDVQRDKLLIETDFKLLSKFNPKRWGDSTQLRHADADGAKLDTSPLVSELLSLMGNGSANTIGATLLADTPAPPKPVYQPRRRTIAEDVGDLV